MKSIIATMFALLIGSCSVFNGVPPTDQAQAKIKEISAVAQYTSDSLILPAFVEGVPTGAIVVKEAVITSDLVFGIVRLEATSSKGHIAELYMILFFDSNAGWAVLGVYPAMDPKAEERMKP